MEPSDIEQQLLRQHGIRIGRHMSRYVLQQLRGGGKPLFVIGGDARTGLPLRRQITLAPPAPPPPPAPSPAPAQGELFT